MDRADLGIGKEFIEVRINARNPEPARQRRDLARRSRGGAAGRRRAPLWLVAAGIALLT